MIAPVTNTSRTPMPLPPIHEGAEVNPVAVQPYPPMGQPPYTGGNPPMHPIDPIRTGGNPPMRPIPPTGLVGQPMPTPGPFKPPAGGPPNTMFPPNPAVGNSIWSQGHDRLTNHLSNIDPQNRHLPVWIHPSIVHHLVKAFGQGGMVLPHPGVKYPMSMPNTKFPLNPSASNDKGSDGLSSASVGNS